MTIPFQAFEVEEKMRGAEYLFTVSKVMRSGWYILGPEVEAFEKEFAEYIGAKYAVGVANGLEALQISLMALGIGPGDEVLTTPLSAIATTLAIIAVGAKPVFVDTDENGLMNCNLLEERVTKRTKAVIPVHLYGNPIDAKALSDFCKAFNLNLIEDAAQAHGATVDGKMVGSFGDIGCFSFYPTKNLGAYGDAGALVTDNEELAIKARMLRNYGQSEKYVHTHYGINSRLDEFHAAVLRCKLRHLDGDLEKRRNIAKAYDKCLMESTGLHALRLLDGSESARHLYVVKTTKRDLLQEKLSQAGITTLVHYPVLIPDQPVFEGKYAAVELPVARQFVSEILSLPIHPFLSVEETRYLEQILREVTSQL